MTTEIDTNTNLTTMTSLPIFSNISIHFTKEGKVTFIYLKENSLIKRIDYLNSLLTPGSATTGVIHTTLTKTGLNFLELALLSGLDYSYKVINLIIL